MKNMADFPEIKILELRTGKLNEAVGSQTMQILAVTCVKENCVSGMEVGESEGTAKPNRMNNLGVEATMCCKSMQCPAGIGSGGEESQSRFGYFSARAGGEAAGAHLVIERTLAHVEALGDVAASRSRNGDGCLQHALFDLL